GGGAEGEGVGLGAVLFVADWGNVEAVGAAMLIGDRQIAAVAAARQAHGNIVAGKRSGLGAHADRHRPTATTGDDVDDTTDSIGAMQAAHRATDDLDPLDVL